MAAKKISVTVYGNGCTKHFREECTYIRINKRVLKQRLVLKVNKVKVSLEIHFRITTKNIVVRFHRSG